MLQERKVRKKPTVHDYITLESKREAQSISAWQALDYARFLLGVQQITPKNIAAYKKLVEIRDTFSNNGGKECEDFDEN